MECTACGNENPKDGKFCSGCGASLSVSTASSTGVESAEVPMTEDRRQLGPDEHFCSSCGEIIKKLAEICPKCGVRLKDAPDSKKDSGKPSPFWKVIWIIGSLLIPLVGLIVGIKYFFTKNRRRYGCLLFCLGVISVIMWPAITASGSGTDESRFSEPTMAPEEIKAQAVDIEYDPLYRNIETHTGKIVHLRGKAVQVVIKGGDRYDLRLAMDDDYGQIVWVTYRGERVLEDDTVEVWGRVNGLHSYKSIFGATITIPEINSLIGVVNP